MPLPKWRWTLSHRILGLAAISVLASQLAGLAVLLTLPPRPPAPVPMDQAIERIREAVKEIESRPPAEAAREARAASDRRLNFSVVNAPPPALSDPFSLRFATLVSSRLNVAQDAVRIVEQAAPRGLRALRDLRRGPARGPGGPAGPEGPPGGGDPGGLGAGPSGGGFERDLAPPGFGRDPPPERPPGSTASGPDRLAGRADGQGFRRGEFNFPRGRRALAVRVGDRWLMVRSPTSPADALWLRQVVLTFALTLAALLLPSLWLANGTARRIRAFAEGADRFGRNPDAPLLPEDGPHELRQATEAFNRMQARIQRLVTDRTMMMAAVSHDLRTPLARVRFRIADLEPAARDAIAEDVQQMDELIGQMLSFTRDALPNTERRRFDLSALCQSVVDDLADSGADVTYEGLQTLTVEADLPAVRRVICNLLENALKFAGHGRLKLEPSGDMAAVIVEDDGPGVPEAMREAVFEPFRRLEPSRNRDTGGVGLGLAIARNLARGHGGDIVLDRVAPAGARFVFSLPLR